MFLKSLVYLIHCASFVSLTYGLEAAECEQWPAFEEGHMEGIEMLQVKHAKVDNLGRNKQRSGLKAVSDVAVAKVKEATSDTTLQLGVSDFEHVGTGCCLGPREIDNGKMWAGNAPDLETCKSKCREFTNCGAVEYGWSGEADKQWCFVWNDMQTCSALDTGPGKCGLGSEGVRAYKFLKEARRKPEMIETQVASTVPHQTKYLAEESPKAVLWECHLYEKGQNDDWCRNTKQFGDHLLLYNGGKSNMCGGCWCCKTRVVFPPPAAAPVSLTGAPAAPTILRPDQAASLQDSDAGSGLPPIGSGLPHLPGQPELPKQVIAGSQPSAATLKLIMELVKVAPIIAFFGSLLFGIGGALTVGFWQRKISQPKADRIEKPLESEWHIKDLAAGIAQEPPAKEDAAGGDAHSDKDMPPPPRPTASWKRPDARARREAARVPKAAAERTAVEEAAFDQVPAVEEVPRDEAPTVEEATAKKSTSHEETALESAPIAEATADEAAIVEEATAHKSTAHEEAALEIAPVAEAVSDEASSVEEAAAQKSTALEEVAFESAPVAEAAAEEATAFEKATGIEEATAKTTTAEEAAFEKAAAARRAAESAAAEQAEAEKVLAEKVAAAKAAAEQAALEQAAAETVEQAALEQAVVEKAMEEGPAAKEAEAEQATPSVNLSCSMPSVRVQPHKKQKQKSSKKVDADTQEFGENCSDVDFQSCGGISDADVEAAA